MIRHTPHGSGHPYSPDTEQRFPFYPVAGENLRLGVRASSDVKAVSLELEVNENLTKYTVPAVLRSSRGQQEDGGHLASAQAKQNRASGGWALDVTLPSDARYLRYRFIASGNKATTTRWYETTVNSWIPADEAILDGVDGNKLVHDSVEVLSDGYTIKRVRFALRLTETEHVIGFGERYNLIDQRGQQLDSVIFEQYKSQGLHSKTYMPMPFAHVVGGNGWGFWVHTNRRVWFDVGATDIHRLTIEAEVNAQSGSTSVLTVSLYQGSPTDVLRQFLDQVGHPTELPSHVFGLWASGNEWNTQAEVLKQARKHIEYDIPISNLVIEAWSDEQTFVAFRDAQYEVHTDGSPHTLSDFTFPDDGAWPNPKAMIDELHSQGVAVYLWQIPLIKMRPHPTGQSRADADFALKNNLLIQRQTSDGKLLPYRNRGWWFPLALMPDLSNPATIEWWISKRRYLVEELGVDGFKTDGGEHAWGADLRYVDGTSGENRNNAFPVYYAKAYGDLMRSCGKAPLTFSRSGYVGSQAHGMFWAGDENSTWDAFRWSMIAGLTASASGILYWGWDIAGFSGAVPTPELYVRAMSASAYVPIMQYHSEFNHHRKPIQDRTPWNIAEQYNDPQVIDDVREIVKRRQALIDYISASTKDCIKSSKPLMRPLFFEHPDDPKVYTVIQWYFGDDFLVTPVLSEGVKSWEVYLPKGTWIEAANGREFTGEQYVTVDVSNRSVTPVFVTARSWQKHSHRFS